MTEDPYRAEHWASPLSGGDGPVWRVVGPGFGGLRGTVPHLNRAMDQRAAEDLAHLLNLARHLGEQDAKRRVREALGLRDFAGDVRLK